MILFSALWQVVLIILILSVHRRSFNGFPFTDVLDGDTLGPHVLILLFNSKTATRHILFHLHGSLALAFPLQGGLPVPADLLRLRRVRRLRQLAR